jgi:hypothetical protein
MEGIAGGKLPEVDGGGMFCYYEGVCECLGMGLEIRCLRGVTSMSWWRWSIMYLSDNVARDFIFPKWILNLAKR